jgi:hypothetical protein
MYIGLYRNTEILGYRKVRALGAMHDHARPHTARATQGLLQSLKGEEF